MNYVYETLENEKQKLLEQIKACTELQQKAELIGNKNLLEYALTLLKKCEEFDIKPRSIFTRLPTQKCRTPSSNYRILEDCETENRQYWIEAEIEGARFKRVELNEDDVVIQI